MTGKRKEEPTIRDISDKLDFVMEIMDARFVAVDKRFDAVDKRFVAVDKKFDAIDKKFVLINGRIDNVDERLGEVKHKLTKVEVTVLDTQDDLRGALAAIDGDSIKVLDHEKRIRRLEKVR